MKLRAFVIVLCALVAMAPGVLAQPRFVNLTKWRILYKVSKRSHLDISSFTAAMLMRRSADRIDSIRIAYGGVGPMILRLPKTESFLTGKPFSLDTLEDAGAIARDEITPISDVRGSRDFRLQLAENVLKKFYYDVASSQ